MSETKFTSGPWKYHLYDDPDCNFILSNVSIDGDDEGRAQDYGRSIIEGFLNGESSKEIEANARLITAAPDLLEACKAVLGIDNPSAGKVGHIDFNFAVQMVRDAVKKAAGE